MTTLRVEARPTPSVPCVVFSPRYDDTIAMMKPKTAVFSVAGIRSVKSISEKARAKYSCGEVWTSVASAR